MQFTGIPLHLNKHEISLSKDAVSLVLFHESYPTVLTKIKSEKGNNMNMMING